MKMVLDDAAGLNLVTAYDPGRVRIRGKVHPTSLLVFPRELETGWDATDVTSLSGRSLQAITRRKPELLILGTGEQQRFPDPRIFIPLMDAGIGYEVMDNTAACRTFNILLGEGREAALALLSDPPR
jgi:uncharacterized protein